MAYLVTTPDPKTGKPRKRAECLWRDEARARADEIAAKTGQSVDILQVRTRGGVPKHVETRPVPAKTTEAPAPMTAEQYEEHQLFQLSS